MPLFARWDEFAITNNGPNPAEELSEGEGSAGLASD